MKALHLIWLGTLVLTACATVVDERRSSIVVDGRSYELRTRLIDGPNGTFEHTSVFVYQTPVMCQPDSPGDCEGKVRRTLSRFDP